MSLPYFSHSLRQPPPSPSSSSGTMYSRLESYPVTTTRPADQILPCPLTKSAVLSSQVSFQTAFPRPTAFIPSRSSFHSSASGSSPEFSSGDVNQYSISVTKPSNMTSQQRPSLSQRALLQGRPLPQVPPLPVPLAPIRHSASNSLSSATIANPSPITSPSSPTTLHRPKRALPIIPPSPRTPQITGLSHFSPSPATPSTSSSDVYTPSPQSSSSVEPFSKLHVNLSIDLSPTTTVIHHLPPLRRHPQTRVAVRRVNAEASSSKVQLPPRSPVSLDDLISPLPPPRPNLKVQTPPLTRALTNHSKSNDRPKLRIRTPSLAEPNSAPFVQARHQLPPKFHPLPRVPIQAESAGRVPNLPRRSSLDSLTMRSSALLSPGQPLSPYVSRRPRSRRFSRSPQQSGFLNTPLGNGSAGSSDSSMIETGVTNRGDHEVKDKEEMIPPMKLIREGPDGGRDGGPDRRWDELSPRHGGRSVAEGREYFLATIPTASRCLNYYSSCT